MPAKAARMALTFSYGEIAVRVWNNIIGIHPRALAANLADREQTSLCLRRDA